MQLNYVVGLKEERNRLLAEMITKTELLNQGFTNEEVVEINLITESSNPS